MRSMPWAIASASMLLCSPPHGRERRRADRVGSAAHYFASARFQRGELELLCSTTGSTSKEDGPGEQGRRRRVMTDTFERIQRQRPDLVVLRQLPDGRGAEAFDLLFWNADRPAVGQGAALPPICANSIGVVVQPKGAWRRRASVRLDLSKVRSSRQSSKEDPSPPILGLQGGAPVPAGDAGSSMAGSGRYRSA